MNHRWTNQELEEATDLEIIEQCLADRKSTCTNYYTPLYRRLKAIEGRIKNLIDSGCEDIYGRSELKENEREVNILKHRIAYWYDEDIEIPEVEQEHIENMINKGSSQGELCYYHPERDEEIAGWWRIL